MSHTLFNTLKRLEQNDISLFNQLSDELNTHQPLILAIMLSLPEKHPMPVADELMKLYLLVWSHFRSNPACLKNQLSENAFAKAYKRNINLLKYLEGETNKAEKTKITQSDLLKVKSLDLMATISNSFSHWPQLTKLSTTDKGLELLTIKTLIESLETLSKK